MSEALVSLARDLHRPRGRERRGLTLAEGIRLVEEALASGRPLKGALTGPALEATPRGRELATALVDRGIPTIRLDEKIFRSVASTDSPQGIVAILSLPEWSWDDLDLATGGTVLLLDGVQDPGNVGGILRSAWGLGARGVIALPGTADPGNPKVLRGAMGASFVLPVLRSSIENAIQWIRDHGVELWVAVRDGEPARSLVRPERLAIAVGNEGAGGSAILQHHAVRQVGIPLRPGVDSLNVAVASAILLYEVSRVS